MNLEARVVPTTPPKDIERKEIEMKATVSHLTDFEKECQQLYNDTEETWNKRIEENDLKQASQKVKEVQV